MERFEMAYSLCGLNGAASAANLHATVTGLHPIQAAQEAGDGKRRATDADCVIKCEEPNGIFRKDTLNHVECHSIWLSRQTLLLKHPTKLK